MQQLEPEGLYVDYYKKTTKDLVKLIKQGQVFRLTAKSGAGKSKYLRYIASSKSVFKKYFSKYIQKIYYIDLNSLYKTDTETLIYTISKTLNCTPATIEEKIQNLLQKNKKVYIIFDHFENSQYYNELSIKYLRSLRDKFKYKLGYILSYEKGAIIDTNKLKYLFVTAPVEINLPPLSKKDANHVLNNEAKKCSIVFTQSEKNKIIKYSKGYGGKIRDVCQQVLLGKNLNSILNKNPKVVIKNPALDYKKILTKLEYLVFSELLTQKENIVTKNKIAELINPTSEGGGVSNEAIDQIIKRLRKKLKDNKVPKKISTKHGIGYYLSN